MAQQRDPELDGALLEAGRVHRHADHADTLQHRGRELQRRPAIGGIGARPPEILARQKLQLALALVAIGALDRVDEVGHADMAFGLQPRDMMRVEE